MAELQQNRYDQLIRRVGGIIGPGSMVSEAIGELFPMLEVETNKAELQALSGSGIAWGSVTSPPNAVENSRVQLFNPLASGKVVTLTSINMRSSGAATDTVYGILGVALTNLSAVSRFRDSRFGTTLAPVAELRQDTNVGGTPATFRDRSSTSEYTKIDNIDGIVVLTPGFGLVISALSVNVSVLGSFIWRERVAEPSELNL